MLAAPRNRTRDGGDQELWELAWRGRTVYELPLKFNARLYIPIAERKWGPKVVAFHSVDREWQGPSPMRDTIHKAVELDSTLISAATRKAGGKKCPGGRQRGR